MKYNKKLNELNNMKNEKELNIDELIKFERMLKSLHERDLSESDNSLSSYSPINSFTRTPPIINQNTFDNSDFLKKQTKSSPAPSEQRPTRVRLRQPPGPPPPGYLPLPPSSIPYVQPPPPQYVHHPPTLITENGNALPLKYINQCNDPVLIEKLKSKNKLPMNYKNNMICKSKNYIKRNSIGSGAYNEVFELEEQGTGNPLIETDVVLRKMLYKQNKISTKDEEDELVGLFIQAYLSKPNPNPDKNSNKDKPLCEQVCRVYEFGRDENNSVYAIIEKLVPASNFFKKIQPDNFITLFPTPTDFCSNIHNIFREILKGLVCIHSHQFAHLDLKLPNIGLTNLKYSEENGYEKKNENELIGAKLFDFGFAKYFPEPDYRHKLGSKIYYMAPETNLYDSVFLKSDVYMFGMILYIDFLREDGAILNKMRGMRGMQEYKTEYLKEFKTLYTNIKNKNFINLALSPYYYESEINQIYGFKTETLENIHIIQTDETIKNNFSNENINKYNIINTIKNRNSAEELLENFEKIEISNMSGGKLHRIRKRNRTKKTKNKKRNRKRKTSKKK